MKTKRNFKFITICALLFVVQIIVCVFVGKMKSGYHCDEIYSYGLANCAEYAFINYPSVNKEGYQGWVDSNFFKHYVSVDTDKAFSFKAAYDNQILDVHPPLYYFALHLICFFFGGVFSKWTGLLLNLIILCLLNFVLFYIGYYFLKDKYKSLIPIMYWSMSSCGLSNIVFIRMYMMLTLALALFIAIHIYAIKDDNPFKFKYLLLIFGNVVFGGLTHYYYYPFAFFFGAPICIFLIKKKKIKYLLRYIYALIGGFVFNLTVFSGTIHHVFFGYRGEEVFGNLGAREENVFTNFYFDWINNSAFGGLLLYFIIGLIIVLPISIFLYKKKNNSEKSNIDFEDEKNIVGLNSKRKGNMICRFSDESGFSLILGFAVSGFSVIVIKGSELTANRYLYPIYPFIILIVILLLSFVAKLLSIKKIIQYILISSISALFCVMSLYKTGVENLYTEIDAYVNEIQDLKGRDCLLYYPVGTWQDVYSTITMSFEMDETHFFGKDDIVSLDEMLKNRKSFDDIVVWIPIETDDNETFEILSDIIRNTDYTQYVLRLEYLTKVYELR